MSGDVSDRKRLVSITNGNLSNKHIYISGHHDFFPSECYGKSNAKSGTGQNLKLFVEGLPDPIETDISKDDGNGRPRNFFRKRGWVRRFFARHNLRPGDVVAIERIDKFAYRIYPFESKNVREGATIPDHWPEIDRKKHTSIDLFAGCGGMSIGLKKAGFENLLAVEWDTSCCETFKANVNPRILQCAIQEVETFPSCDLLVGGPPCQGFSNLGERVPNNPRRQLWRHFLRAVRDVNPPDFGISPPIFTSHRSTFITRIGRDRATG